MVEIDGKHITDLQFDEVPIDSLKKVVEDFYQESRNKEEDPEYEKCVDKKHLSIWKKKDPVTEIHRIKFHGILQHPMEVIDKVLNDFEIRKQWDKGLKELDSVVKVDDNLEIMYMAFKAPPAVRNRDFLHLRITDENGFEETSKIVLDVSTNHPEHPIKKKFIRANTLFSGLLLSEKKNDDGSLETEYITVSQVDFKGDIPKGVVNMLASRMPPDWFDNLDKACKSYLKNEFK